MSADVKDTLEEARALEDAVRRHNDVHAMIQLASLLLYDHNFHSQRARGVQLLERAIKQAHNPGAMYSLACYLLRQPNRRAQRRAFLLLERSLKLHEHVDVLQQLGTCYLFGEGVHKDVTLAVQLLERAARLNEDPYVLADLAYGLLHEPALKAQRRRAISLYENAIRLSPEAHLMNGLGLLYHTGTCNLRANAMKAWKWYERAIETSNFPSAMYNQAVLLLESESEAREQRAPQAVRLLENAWRLEKDEKTIVKLADTYLEYGIDVQRATELYETAAIEFNSAKARSVLIRALVDRTCKVPSDQAREFAFCERDFSQTKNLDSLKTMAEMLWTGADQVRMNRKKAMQLLESVAWSSHDCLSLMLRQDARLYSGGRRKAQALLDKLTHKIDVHDVGNIECIVLSESARARDKALAAAGFREQKQRQQSMFSVAWLAPHLRVGAYALPFDGRLHCVTKATRTFARWTNVAALNLASVLLEMDGQQQQAVTVLEEVMQGELRLLGMLNLSWVLTHDVQGVRKECARGLRLVEQAVQESNDVCARAMLGGALAERADCAAGDVERARKVWRSVKEEVHDEHELRNVARLISASSWEIVEEREERCM